MIKKVIAVLELVILIAAVAFGVYTYMQKAKIVADRDTLLTQNTQLQQSIDAIGPFTTVYTVKAIVKENYPVKEDDLVAMTIPASAVPANAITDISQIKVKNPYTGAEEEIYYKVPINPQTMLTSDLLMTEDYTQPLYERDIYLEWLPIGLKANDCIDIRVSYPDGTDLVAFEHKRIYMVLDNVIKIKLTYPELVRYTSLQTEKDFYKSASLGFRVYATAYIEPGLTKDSPSKVMYPISTSAEVIVARDPNISNKTELINSELRTYLDTKMSVYLPQGTADFGIYSKTSMLSEETSALNQSHNTFKEMYVGTDNAAIEQPTDLTGTGWDGELLNGGTPYVTNDDLQADGAEGDIATEGDDSGLESLGSIGSSTTPTQSPVDSLNDKVNEASDILNDFSNSIETTPVSMETKPAADSSGNEQSITDESKEAVKKTGNLFNTEDDLD